MAMTPYPNSNDRLENPSIRVSDDGAFWTLPSDLRDPVVPAPERSDHHHSDPFILIKSETLHLFFRTTDKTKSKSIISWTQTKDLINWTPTKVIYHGDWILSPSIIYEDGFWKMWFVDKTGNSSTRIMYATGTSPENFCDATPCELMLEGYQCWHIEVRKDHEKFRALINAFPGDENSNRQVLFFANSLDGIQWQVSFEPIAKPTIFGWDNKLLYKASFQLQENDVRIWYSASSYGRKWYIGEMIGTFNSVRRVSGNPPQRIFWSLKFFDDFLGYSRLMIGRFIKKRFIRQVRT